MKRRSFLKTASLLGAGIMGSAAIGRPVSTKTPKVGIIGAGLAGLSAAYRLKKAGIPCTVLESRNRIGGRVFTWNIDPEEKLTIELGAEWIGDHHDRMLALCKEFGLAMKDHRFETRMIYNGEFFERIDWSPKKALLDEALKTFDNLPLKKKESLDRYSWFNYLWELGLEERDIEILELLNSTDFGETIRMVSANAAFSEYAYSSAYNEMDLWIEGGNSRLVEAIADSVGRENIRTGTTVQVIEQEKQGVRLTIQNGEILSFDHVICAIPTFSARKITWKPGLPPSTLEAMRALPYSRIAKHSVLFSNRFWKDDNFDMVTDLLPHYYFHSTKLQTGTKGVLTSYSIGDKAVTLSRMPKEQRMKAICDGLRGAFGDVTSLAKYTIGYHYGSDTHVMGAYALYSFNQWTQLRPELMKSFLSVHFAGEHIGEWQGFMEGAVQSGEDAADAIIG